VSYAVAAFVGVPNPSGAVASSLLDALHGAFRSPQPLSRLVLVVSPDHAFLTTRAKLGDEYHAGGMHKLACALARRTVPRDHLLILALTDDGPRMRTVPSLAAIRMLVAGAAPALRVVSKVAGAYGNAIEVSVTNGAYGYALLARVGTSYVEAFQVAGRQSPMVATSKSLAAAALVQGAARADNAGFAALSDGVGASLTKVQARLDAAAKLPALTDAQRFLATEHRRLVALAHGPKPSAASFRGSPELVMIERQRSGFEVERKLIEEVAKAASWLAQTA
jgi:hypothetical protein